MLISEAAHLNQDIIAKYIPSTLQNNTKNKIKSYGFCVLFFYFNIK